MENQEMTLGQFVKLLASRMHQEKIPLPFKNQKPWHLALYCLKEETEGHDRPDFIDDLEFDWDSDYPSCEELSDFLNALHFTANVAVHNPRFDIISVDEKDAERWSEQLDGLNDSSQELLEAAVNIARIEFESAAA